MAAYINARGETQQIKLDVTMYRQAAERGMSLQQFLNTEHADTGANGPAFNQILASEGIFVQANRDVGIRPSTMEAILNGRPNMEAGVNVKDAVPTSRILFPAVIMQAVEDKLLQNLAMTANALEDMIAIDETINGERYEHPVVNFSKPEAARSQGSSQLAPPPSMMTITTSDKAYRIPSFALGLEVSDQALKATTIDFVALSLARQAAVERNERANNYLLAIFNGDVDNGEGSLASLGLVDNASTFDAAATGGTLTQKAWMKYLMKNGTKRTITHLVTDIDTAMKIEGRTGKPTVMQDNGTTNRFDTQFNVMNPTWAKNPKLFLVENAAWAANTIMGLDASWAIRRVRNLSADYQGIESYVLRRSQAMRFDFGEHVNRLYNDAYGCMVLA